MKGGLSNSLHQSLKDILVEEAEFHTSSFHPQNPFTSWATLCRPQVLKRRGHDLYLKVNSETRAGLRIRSHYVKLTHQQGRLLARLHRANWASVPWRQPESVIQVYHLTNKGDLQSKYMTCRNMCFDRSFSLHFLLTLALICIYYLSRVETKSNNEKLLAAYINV